MSAATKSLGTAVIAGVGNGTGVGASTARLFASKGYSVALISRSADELDKLASSIKASGGEAAAFPIEAYDHASLASAFTAIANKWPAPGLRFALFNAGDATWGKFLTIKEEDIKKSVQTNIVGAFAFGQEVVRAILATTGEKEVEYGHRGTLLFTGATAALRGSEGFGAFAAGKFGIRAIAQSVAREYGKEGIHVAHSIIDGSIVTDRGLAYTANNPEAQAKYKDNRRALSPDSIAKSYWYLHEQDPSAWTQELDLRPAHEKF
ncbi:hypothetical protein MNV49_005011 [Pseudohyphozyma bogoriensis]|nr:hypothetical protein MNV49_005011 [Pseudohyphozyma bogoriensis]